MVVEGDIVDPLLVPSELLEQRTGLDVPEVCDSEGTAYNERRSVGREFERGCRTGPIREASDFGAGCHVPQHDDSRTQSGRQHLTIRREGPLDSVHRVEERAATDSGTESGDGLRNRQLSRGHCLDRQHQGQIGIFR